MARNYVFDKTLRPYETLTEEEKDIIFYPKLSFYNMLEIFETKKISRFYNPHSRCQVKFSLVQIVQIWVIVFFNTSGFALNMGFTLIFNNLPNLGLISKDELNSSNKYLDYPFNVLSALIFYILLRLSFSLYFSKCHLFKLIRKLPTCRKKISLILQAFFAAYQDIQLFTREEIPFLSSSGTNEGKINENWFDNQEP